MRTTQILLGALSGFALGVAVNLTEQVPRAIVFAGLIVAVGIVIGCRFISTRGKE